MSNVEFDESANSFTSRRILGEEIVPGMVKALQKTGLAKNSNQAKYILIGVAVTAFVITVGVIVSLVSGGRSSVPKTQVDKLMPADHAPYIKN